MTGEQWEYMDKLAELGKFEKWSHHQVTGSMTGEDVVKVMAKMYSYLFEIRCKDVINYKNVNFQLEGDDFKVVT